MIARMFTTVVAFAFALMLAARARNASAADHVLLVGGQAGESAYAREFSDTLLALRAALIERQACTPDHLSLFMEDGQIAPDISTTATLSALRAEFERLRASLTTSDTLTLILLGHGQSDYVEPRFHLAGSDLTATELDRLLAGLPTSRQRMILAFSCSGSFSEILGRGGRVILASTDGPRQIYKTVLPAILVKAFQSDVADENADGQVDFRELFDHLSVEVAAWFDSRGQLSTETPSLEDNGDGRLTTRQEGMDAGDGQAAAQTILLPARRPAESDQGL